METRSEKGHMVEFYQEHVWHEDVEKTTVLHSGAASEASRNFIKTNRMVIHRTGDHPLKLLPKGYCEC